jgi:hypothetical protein
VRVYGKVATPDGLLLGAACTISLPDAGLPLRDRTGRQFGRLIAATPADDGAHVDLTIELDVSFTVTLPLGPVVLR